MAVDAGEAARAVDRLDDRTVVADDVLAERRGGRLGGDAYWGPYVQRPGWRLRRRLDSGEEEGRYPLEEPMEEPRLAHRDDRVLGHVEEGGRHAERIGRVQADYSRVPSSASAAATAED